MQYFLVERADDVSTDDVSGGSSVDSAAANVGADDASGGSSDSAELLNIDYCIDWLVTKGSYVSLTCSRLHYQPQECQVTHMYARSTIERIN